MHSLDQSLGGYSEIYRTGANLRCPLVVKRINFISCELQSPVDLSIYFLLKVLGHFLEVTVWSICHYHTLWHNSFPLK